MNIAEGSLIIWVYLWIRKASESRLLVGEKKENKKFFGENLVEWRSSPVYAALRHYSRSGEHAVILGAPRNHKSERERESPSDIPFLSVYFGIQKPRTQARVTFPPSRQRHHNATETKMAAIVFWRLKSSGGESAALIGRERLATRRGCWLVGRAARRDGFWLLRRCGGPVLSLIWWLFRWFCGIFSL